ncbi:MAG: hypothetical protein JNJ60_19475 [Rhodocyclaceae bacterium]|nr:hypothetical protein [Rhodocyclaceae bacterium]
MTVRVAAWLLLALAAAAAAALGLRAWNKARLADASLAARMAQIQPVRDAPRLDCAALAAQKPLVLLALGQSNGGNHGVLENLALPPVPLFADGICVAADDPLPGATGSGGSIWRRLPAALAERGWSRPVLISVLAVDSSSIAEWTRADGALAAMLARRVQSMHAQGLAPQLILWQQGEADAKAGTTAADYGLGLDRLAAMLQANGNAAPIVLARSTLCRSVAQPELRSAIAARAAADARFRLGPDTDSLAAAAYRHDACHLSAAGLARAAQMWAEVIASLSR